MKSREDYCPVRHTFLKVEGKAGKLIAAYDWSATSLGSIETWPEYRRTTINLILHSPIPTVTMWGEDGILIYNDAYAAFAGKRHPRILGMKACDSWPEFSTFTDEMIRNALAGNRVTHRDLEVTLYRNDYPEQAWINLDYSPIPDADGTPVGTLVHVNETTRRVRTERRLEIAGDILRQMLEQSPSFNAVTSGPDHVFVIANESFINLTGHRNIIGRTVSETYPEVVRQGYKDLMDEVFRTRKPYVGRSVAVDFALKPDATPETRYLNFIFQPIVLKDDETFGIFIQGYDLTEQRLAENELRRLNDELELRVAREVADRYEAEEALRQSQKMEALGKLTGGVAHDFNNLLHVISGNLQLLQKDLENQPELQRRVTQALAGVGRGSRLAGQLLAFGRRQTLQPHAVNIGDLLKGMEDMILRTIGAGIKIETIIPDDLWDTFADPGQIENALLNLAINARDAMGKAGNLTIRAQNNRIGNSHPDLKPGDYVLLTVEDTGKGIPPEMLSKVFEPFFSTKKEGEGTGLGLSIVYGFTKQSGGHIDISSRVGEGTAVKLYLPKTEMKAQKPASSFGQKNPLLNGNNETILLVESDSAVRTTTGEMLKELGYHVVESDNFREALGMIGNGLHVNLLIADIAMPGETNATELLAQAREKHPDMAMLFTSSYADELPYSNEEMGDGIELISKPYTHEALSQKLREALAACGSSIATMSAATEEKESLSLSGLKVLLCEDEILIRMSTAEMLENFGCRVLEAGDAAEALNLMGSGEPDILVTDVGLPDMRGDELAKRFAETRQDAVVIFTTGDADFSPQDGSYAHITLQKPYDYEQIARAITALIPARKKKAS